LVLKSNFSKNKITGNQFFNQQMKFNGERSILISSFDVKMQLKKMNASQSGK